MTDQTLPEAMVEIVASALCECDGRDPDGDWTLGDGFALSVALPPGEQFWWRQYINKARAALTALADAGYVIMPREATTWTIYALANALRPFREEWQSRDSGTTEIHVAARILYRAMRDAAMGGKG